MEREEEGRKCGQINCKTHFLAVAFRFFLVSKRSAFLLLGGSGLDVAHWEGQASWSCGG